MMSFIREWLRGRTAFSNRTVVVVVVVYVLVLIAAFAE